MGMYCSIGAATREEAVQGTNKGVSLEKSWHGLHYLLTGEAGEADGPLAFLLCGGEILGDEEDGRRWFNPAQTQGIASALDPITDDQLWSRYDPEAMSEAGVYPEIWDEDEDELREEYVEYFQELKKALHTAAGAGKGLSVTIG